MRDRLLLARLLAAGETGATESALRKDLEPILARASSSSEARAALLSLIEQAIEQGWASRELVRKRAAYRLTPEGLALSKQYFPNAERLTWAQLKKTWLVVHALGLETQIKPEQVKELSKAATLRLVLLNHHLELGLPVVPDSKAFDMALAWHVMRQGLSEPVHRWAKGKGLTLTVILAALAASVGEVSPSVKKAEVYARFAAKIAGARNANDLHAALLARLVKAQAPSDAKNDAPNGAAEADAFAERVVLAARRSSTGKLDPSLILINHAYQRYVEENPEDSVSLDDFKDRLWSAALDRALVLASADMPQTLDPNDYRDSRIDRGASVYALIRI